MIIKLLYTNMQMKLNQNYNEEYNKLKCNPQKNCIINAQNVFIKQRL